MKKYLFIALLVLLLPSITYAAWWNPLTWNWNPVTWITTIFSHPQTQLTGVPTSTATITLTAPSMFSVSEETNNAPSELSKVKSNAFTQSNTLQPVTAVPSQQDTQTQPTNQQAVAPSVPPSNTTLCNGTYYTTCPTGENFVCPSGGSNAYCQPNQQQLNAQAAAETQAQQQATQQRTNQINALTQQYNTTKALLDQQIIDLNQQILAIKNKYYSDIANVQNSRTNLTEANGEIQQLTSTANLKIDQINSQIQQIQLQEQQLYLNYTSQVNSAQ